MIHLIQLVKMGMGLKTHITIYCSVNHIRVSTLPSYEISQTNNYPNKKKIEILLYGSVKLSDEENNNILKESINYIIKTKRFEN